MGVVLAVVIIGLVLCGLSALVSGILAWYGHNNGIPCVQVIDYKTDPENPRIDYWRKNALTTGYFYKVLADGSWQVNKRYGVFRMFGTDIVVDPKEWQKTADNHGVYGRSHLNGVMSNRVNELEDELSLLQLEYNQMKFDYTELQNRFEERLDEGQMRITRSIKDQRTFTTDKNKGSSYNKSGGDN